MCEQEGTSLVSLPFHKSKQTKKNNEKAPLYWILVDVKTLQVQCFEYKQKSTS